MVYQDEERASVIPANWGKKCPGCGEPIEEGDQIGRVDGDWVCQACVDDNGGEDQDVA